MGMNTTELLRVARCLSRHRGVTLATLGRYAANHGAFFSRLGEGKTITEARKERVSQWFSDNWPDDLEWPPGIPRPDPAPRREAAA